MIEPDLTARRRTAFVLWRPRVTDPVPRLVLGIFAAGNPPALTDPTVVDLRPTPACGTCGPCRPPTAG
jgi:hypothetical protein